MKQLITGQELNVDSHSAGQVLPDNIYPHIHKKFRDGKWKGKSIRINLPDGDIRFNRKYFSADDEAEIRNKVEKELNRNMQKLRDFGQYVGRILKNWNKGITLDEARKYAKNIAERFKLQSDAKKEFVEQVGNKIMRFLSVHEDDAGNISWIDLSANTITIGPGGPYFRKIFKRL